MPLSTELFWLTLTVIMTALLWLPYILNRLIEKGFWTAMRNPQAADPAQALWAQRMQRAHLVAVENLVIFAPLVLMLHLAGISDARTETACMVYFYAFLVHFVVFALGIPVLRVLAFMVAFAAQMTLAVALLGAF